MRLYQVFSKPTVHLRKLGCIAMAISWSALADDEVAFKAKIDESPVFKEQYQAISSIVGDALNLSLLQVLEGDTFVQGEYVQHWRSFNNSLELTNNHEARLDVTAKGFLISHNFVALSLRGYDRLVFGGFGGFGSVAQEVSSLQAKEATQSNDAEKIYYKTDSKLFVGGAVIAYQSKIDDPTGLRIGAALQYNQFSTSFKGTDDAVNDKDQEFKHTVDSIGTTIAAGYTLKLVQLSVGSLLVTQSNQLSVQHYIKGDQNQKRPISLRNGLKFALAQYDQGLEPFVSADFVTVLEHKDDLGQAVKKSLTAEIGSGFHWQLADNLSLQAKLNATRALGKGAWNAEHFIKINGFRVGAGLNYTF
ncbi:MAG: hypothetical protein IPK86_03585 [Neisseriales bacterium]|nr:MAG: hypothetical protein IPK86_03585 [Neisseriales bacterium]